MPSGERFSLGKLLYDLLPEAAWAAIEGMWDRIPQKYKSFMVTVLTEICAFIFSTSWLVWAVSSAVIFGLSMLGLNQIDAMRDRRRRRPLEALPTLPPVPEQNGYQEPKDKKHDLSLLASLQDAANRKGIVVLVRVHVEPVHTVALVVTQGLFGPLNGSDDAKRRTIFLLLNTYVVHPYNTMYGDLSRAVGSPDEETVEGLQQKLWKFFEAYQKLVCWTNHLSRHFYISPSGDPGYNAWKENHKSFCKKLEELIASDDFFKLPENLQGQWHDIEP